MALTKSGIETPSEPPKKPLEAPVKVYPGSSKIGKGGSSGTVEGPASDGYKGRGRR